MGTDDSPITARPLVVPEITTLPARMTPPPVTDGLCDVVIWRACSPVADYAGRDPGANVVVEECTTCGTAVYYTLMQISGAPEHIMCRPCVRIGQSLAEAL